MPLNTPTGYAYASRTRVVSDLLMQPHCHPILPGCEKLHRTCRGTVDELRPSRLLAIDRHINTYASKDIKGGPIYTAQLGWYREENLPICAVVTLHTESASELSLMCSIAMRYYNDAATAYYGIYREVPLSDLYANVYKLKEHLKLARTALIQFKAADGASSPAG